MQTEDQRREATTLAFYQVAAQHWAHAEQIRWTLLYNYLMASTILLLAWATVFAASRLASVVLLLLSAAGVALSMLWVALGSRATSFVKMYVAIGRDLEVRVRAGQLNAGPFESAELHRNVVRGMTRVTPSHVVLWLVPTLFVGIYLTLLVISATPLVISSYRPASCIAAAVAYALFVIATAIEVVRRGSTKRFLGPFCSFCGARTTSREIDGKLRNECPACGRIAYRQLIVGAGVLVENNGALLLLQRTIEPFFGMWNLPAGHVDADEDPAEAARREALEETGLNVEIGALQGVYYFSDHPAGHGIFLVCRSRVVSGQLHTTEENRSAAFFTKDKLPGNIAGGGHQQAIGAWRAGA